MIRPTVVCGLVSVLICTAGCGPGPRYFRAEHGFGGGMHNTVDLSECEGFDDARSLQDLAELASSVPGAIGFTAHPDFESGERYASAVVWYTKMSPPSESWGLFLFDRAEANKKPGDSPRAAAVAAAEAWVAGKLKEAQELIDAGGPGGVKLSGNYEEMKALAFAVMRLGGSFKHGGEFAVGPCGACRSVVSGGDPSVCGLGLQNEKHWTCCGSTNETGYCQYWKLIKKQDDSG